MLEEQLRHAVLKWGQKGLPCCYYSKCYFVLYILFRVRRQTFILRKTNQTYEIPFLNPDKLTLPRLSGIAGSISCVDFYNQTTHQQAPQITKAPSVTFKVANFQICSSKYCILLPKMRWIQRKKINISF